MKFVALLRGINVTGANKVSMAALRAACGGIGLENVETYIQSGNLVFSAAGSAREQEEALESLLRETFGLSIPVIVRTAKQWPAIADSNPFPEAAKAEPNRLLLCLSKSPPDGQSAEALQARAKDGEQVRLTGNALWIHFPGGSGKSKLTPSLLDRLVGSPVTSRNYRPAMKMKEMIA